jgi:hypothetical protein
MRLGLSKRLLTIVSLPRKCRGCEKWLEYQDAWFADKETRLQRCFYSQSTYLKWPLAVGLPLEKQLSTPLPLIIRHGMNSLKIIKGTFSISNVPGPQKGSKTISRVDTIRNQKTLHRGPTMSSTDD